MKRLINHHPNRAAKIGLALLPFVLGLLIYMAASSARLTENPNDKLLPSFGSFVEAIDRMAFEPDKRSGDYLFWKDTAASLTRIGLGIGISALMGLVFGVLNGMIPYVRANLGPFIAALSMVPPMAVLPILFIIFGLGEVSKVVLICFGIAPFMMRDMQQRTQELPQEQLIKAQTLGGSTWQIMLRVVLPQVLPRLMDAVRLALGAAWIFLISAEAIAATDGLGYRIFLVRRYLAMDVILPYVVWITLLAYAFDFSLRKLQGLVFPWYGRGQ